MPSKTSSSTRTEMSEVMTPQHANFLGKVFGGVILSKIDLAAYATASRFAGNVAVTAAIDRVDFHEPIEVGEVVTCVAAVTYVGFTSLEVTIEVFAENVLEGTRRHTNTARVTCVALKDGRPVEVPRLLCETREEKVRFLEGKLRRELRVRRQAETQMLVGSLQDLDERRLDELLLSEDLLGELRRISPS